MLQVPITAEYIISNIPVFHLNPYLLLLYVIWKRLYKTASASDSATLCQLRNLLKRRSVTTSPKKKFDACHDFFMLVLSAHIIVASMEILGMQNVADTPSEILIPPDILDKSKDERREVLDHVVEVVINTFVDITTVMFKVPQTPDSDTNSSQPEGQACQNANSDDEDEDLEEEMEDAAEVEEVNKEGIAGDNGKAPKKDDVFRYACELLSLGLLYSEYSDAIKDGDGPREFRCFKYMLPMFKASNRVNYACEIFCILAQVNFILSPRLSHQLQWSRFINTQGKIGRNIPCDLHMEHLNRIVKNGIRGLGANKAETAMIWLGKCVDTVSEVMENYDNEHGINAPSAHHTKASENKDLDILQELSTRNNPFVVVPGRKHRHVSVPKTRLLQLLDEVKFSAWMKEKWYSLLAGLI